MVELLGYSGAFLFAFCGLPQAILSYRQGNSNGVSSALLAMWGSGEIIMIIYTLLKIGFDGPLLMNYLVNLLFVGVISYYKIYPRKEGNNVS